MLALVPKELGDWQASWASMLNTGHISPALYCSIMSSRKETTERLSIYRQSFFITKHSVLTTLFKATHRLVGGEVFDALATRFLQNHQSTIPDTHDVGIEFPRFIQDNNVLPSYAGDLAQFEWCWHSVFHGPSQARLSREVLMQTVKVQQTGLLLVTTAGVRTLTSRYLLDECWQQLIEASICLWRASSAGSPSHCFTFVQCDSDVRVYRVPCHVGVLLEACRQSLTLARLVEDYAEVESWLPWLIEKGLLSLASPIKLP